ncbi:hypothetical protein SAMN05421749_103450 [Acinetobacter marinus]|uniref:Uncharacterized protein n=1 Tax=Acinetobacter marinus TaxID=281375 RepID=A0A1G6JUK8_9GAMM|nr:hypothetical protein [Acinetobacter marinus]SDC22085.1 hypothetical protein SAMN05421749_103450 [Acinetobacter marinus]
MSTQRVHLHIQDQTFRTLEELNTRITHGYGKDLSTDLGQVFTEITHQVLDQVFLALIQSNKLQPELAEHAFEAEKALDHIRAQLQKYMPWAVGMLSNDRLVPVSNHMLTHFDLSHSHHSLLCYAVPTHLVQDLFTSVERIQQGDQLAVDVMLKHLIEVIDLGVTEFIRKPKTMLKFNFVVDKTLNGVIHLVTSLGYKRIAHMAQYASPQLAIRYATHFQQFIYADADKNESSWQEM